MNTTTTQPTTVGANQNCIIRFFRRLGAFKPKPIPKGTMDDREYRHAILGVFKKRWDEGEPPLEIHDLCDRLEQMNIRYKDYGTLFTYGACDAMEIQGWLECRHSIEENRNVYKWEITPLGHARWWTNVAKGM